MTLPATSPLELAELTVTVYRAPVARPVRTAFGAMTDRPAVIVRARTADGTTGHGEIWCNFPTCGAEHRARLVTSLLGAAGGRPQLAQPGGGVCGADPARRARGAPGRRARAARPGDRRHRHRALGPRGAAGRTAALAPAGRPGRRPPAGLCQRHQSGSGGRAGAGRERAPAIGRSSSRSASAARPISAISPRCARRSGRRRRSRSTPTRPGSSPRRPLMSRALAAFDPLWLEEPIAADSPLEDWQRLAASRADAARRRRESARRCPVRCGDRRGRARDLPAGRRQMGRHHRLPAARAAGARGRPALLPALPRRRHRPARLGPPAGRCRRRRPARDRLQSQPVTRGSCDASSIT